MRCQVCQQYNTQVLDIETDIDESVSVCFPCAEAVAEALSEYEEQAGLEEVDLESVTLEELEALLN